MLALGVLRERPVIEVCRIDVSDHGDTTIKARCSKCRQEMAILTNREPRPQQQPFCMCTTCGTALYDYESRAELAAVVAKKGWSQGVMWLITKSAASPA